jgi:hypothetical protein
MNRRCGRAMNPLPRQATPVMAPVTMVGDEGGDSDQPRCNIRNCKTLDDNITERVPQANKQKYGKVASGLGDLDKLPLEVQSNILVHLDLQTLVNFRRVNRQAREVVDALPEYQKILHFSPTSLLRSIFTIQLEAFITCQALVTTLNTQKCEDCGDPSEYIHLLTCRRVCCHCLLSRGEYKSTTLECAEWEFQVPRRLLEGLPTMKAVVSLPTHLYRSLVGVYGWFRVPRRKNCCASPHSLRPSRAACCRHGAKAYNWICIPTNR